MESDHGEHLLSERRLVMGHCPRAHQRSRNIIGHEWSAQGPLNSPVGRAACAHPPHRGGSPVGYRNARALPPEAAGRERGQSPKPARGPMRRAHRMPEEISYQGKMKLASTNHTPQLPTFDLRNFTSRSGEYALALVVEGGTRRFFCRRVCGSTVNTH